LSPLTPINPVHSPPAVVEQAATPGEEEGKSAGASARPSPSHLGISIPNLDKSHEKLSEPTTPSGPVPGTLTPGTTTPSKERKLPILFQRMGSSESGELTRQPNKLKKKRIPGSSNPSAHSSTASLSHGGVSPNADIGNPLEAIPSVSKADAESLEPTPQEMRVPPRSVPAPPEGSDAHGADGSKATHADPAQPVPGASTLHPSGAQAPLKSKRSPPTSLHSSFNENSDIDQVVEDAAPLPAPTTAPPEVPVPDTPNNDKEKKRRWRLSRKKEDVVPPSTTSQPIPPPLASPRAVPLGSNDTASASGTSLNSSSKLGPSVTASGDTSDRTTINTSMEPPLTEVSSKESKDKEKDDGNKISAWIKNKYREHKENVEQRARNKSPPGARNGGAALGASLLVQSSSSLSTRGKSLDLKRSTEEEGGKHAGLPPPLPTAQTMPTQNLQGLLLAQQTQTQPVAQTQTQTQQQQTTQEPAEPRGAQ
jgi:hypothetical protein